MICDLVLCCVEIRLRAFALVRLKNGISNESISQLKVREKYDINCLFLHSLCSTQVAMVF